MRTLFPPRAKQPAAQNTPSESASPAERAALAFFAAREALAARVADHDSRIAAEAQEAERLLSTDVGSDVESLTSKLAMIEARKRMLTIRRDTLAAELNQFDRDFETATANLRGAISYVRAECLREIHALVSERIGWAFGCTTGKSAAELEAAAQELQHIVSKSEYVRKESDRHFALLSFHDYRRSIAAYLPLVAIYRRELQICHARLAAIREMQTGARELSSDLESFELPGFNQKPTKSLNLNYDRPETEEEFAARRAARLERWERRRDVLRSQNLKESEIKEMILHAHPDRDRSFKRRTGSN